ncbi:MAG: hypothetical protein M0C28_39855 [Candidatus Moduliflexus flocculans]|nr:hypothetical protein [Candidatus Moduliflexus flocculans]
MTMLMLNGLTDKPAEALAAPGQVLAVAAEDGRRGRSVPRRRVRSRRNGPSSSPAADRTAPAA